MRHLHHFNNGSYGWQPWQFFLAFLIWFLLIGGLIWIWSGPKHSRRDSCRDDWNRQRHTKLVALIDDRIDTRLAESPAVVTEQVVITKTALEATEGDVAPGPDYI